MEGGEREVGERSSRPIPRQVCSPVPSSPGPTVSQVLFTYHGIERNQVVCYVLQVCC